MTVELCALRESAGIIQVPVVIETAVDDRGAGFAQVRARRVPKVRLVQRDVLDERDVLQMFGRRIEVRQVGLDLEVVDSRGLSERANQPLARGVASVFEEHPIGAPGVRPRIDQDGRHAAQGESLREGLPLTAHEGDRRGRREQHQ